MAGYGDIVTGTQEFYSDFSEASRSVSEATGSYFGKMREQQSKEGRWNQTLDAGFSLFKGYQEGAQEHADAANVAKESGFEYKQPESLWDTYQGVDKDQMHTRYFKDKEGVEQFQQISGTDLKNMSDLYKAGGTKSLGDVSEYGTVNKSYTAPGQYSEEKPWKASQSPYEDMPEVSNPRRSMGGIEMGKFHKEFMGGTDKSSLQYQEKFNQQNINSLTRQARRAGGQDMTSEEARDAARDLFGDTMYDSYVGGRQFARRKLKGFE
jgi:hypothetical protein